MAPDDEDVKRKDTPASDADTRDIGPRMKADQPCPEGVGLSDTQLRPPDDLPASSASNIRTRDIGPQVYDPAAAGGRDTLRPSVAHESVVGSRDTLRRDPEITPSHDSIAAKQMKNRVFGRLFNKRERLKIGRYDILDNLGHGGMGVVYSAYDDELDRKVAIKVLVGEVDGDAELRFKREAQAMARLNHANVVTVHEVGDADGRVFIAMEFVRGQSLADYCEVPLPWQETIGLYVQAGRGLIAAHDADIVHRDLKPHNIMRGEDGVVKVLDFGLARAGDSVDESATRIDERESSGSILDVEITRAGTLVGTPAYMAPEAFAGLVVDARSDQFSFCVALYEALYGQLPFVGKTIQELTYNTARGEIQPPPSGSKVPGWLHRIVVRGLNPESAQRWPSMRALVGALERDPSRVRRRQLTVIGLAGLTGMLGFALSGLFADPVEDCDAAREDVTAVWSESRGEQVRRAFSNSGYRLADDTAELVLPRLDAYAFEWSEMRVGACELHLAGQQSDRLFDLRTACLDRSRAQLDALAGAFELADASIVEGAAWAVASLPSIATCGNVDILTAAVPPPEDREIRREVKVLREALSGVTALVDLGRYEDALNGSKQVLARAEELDYEPLIAESLLRLGTSQLEAQQHERARDSLSRSAAAAIRSGDSGTAAEALARRMWIVAEPLGQPAVGLADADVAGALVSRQREPYLRWLYHNNHGAALIRSGDGPAAEQAYRGALSVLADRSQAHPVELISTGYNLGSLLMSNARPASAAKEFRRVRQKAITLLGPNHPRVAIITFELALALNDIGQRIEALALLDRSFAQLGPGDEALRVSHHGTYANLWLYARDYQAVRNHTRAALEIITREFPGHQHTIQARSLQAVAQIALGEVDAGLEELRAVVSETDERIGRDHEASGYARWWLGTGLFIAGQRAAAVEELGRANAIYAQLGAVAPASVVRHGARLVEALLAHGDLDKAEETIDVTANAQRTIGLGERNTHRLELAKLRGELALARGQHAAASRELERACNGMAATRDPDDPLLSLCRLSWARALGPTPEGKTLARQARSAFESLGDGFASERAQAEALANGTAVPEAPTGGDPRL